MKKHELFNKLLKVKESVQVIKNCSDDLNKVDDTTAAQYNIQDIMTDIVDDLLNCLFQTSVNEKSKITDEVYTSYISDEDKTIVWHNIYVDGELVSSELAGWYCGEPDVKTTEEYSKSNNTAYYFDL